MRRTWTAEWADPAWPFLAFAGWLVGKDNLAIHPAWAYPLRAFSLLVLPYLFLRIVRRFYAVPRLWMQIGIATPIAMATFRVFVHPETPRLYLWTSNGYQALGAAVAIAILSRQALRVGGLSGYRLWMYVGWISAAAALMWAINGTMRSERFVDRLPYWPKQIMNYGAQTMLLFSIAGLAPPRFLKNWFLRAKEYRFLRTTTERSPDVRGAKVAQDLADAVAASVTGLSVAVAIGENELRVVGASDKAWLGATAAPSRGASRAISNRTVITDAIHRLEPEWQPLAKGAGLFLAAPIIGRQRVWGVLLITQYQTPLFPKDELELINRLCRYTAEALDHAQIIEDDKRRQQRDADARLDLILESLSDYAVITVNEDATVTSWNHGAELLLGYSADSITGQPAARLFDDDAPWLKSELRRAAEGEARINEIMVNRRDGMRIIASVVVRPLMEGERQSGGFVLVMHDISEQKTLEEQLRQGQKLEAIGRLAGGVAHDFNNTLTSILSFAEELGQSANDEQRAHVYEIQKAGERGAALTKQLMAFSKRQKLKPQVVELPGLVKGLLPLLSRLIGSGIQVVDRIEPPVPPVLGDSAQIEQVVVNLAINARDAMSSQGTLTITVKRSILNETEAASLAVVPGLFALLEVSDTGTGMDRATQARIFEPYFTTKEPGRGTGLGLATVYGTVRQMNGAITCESEVGQGTTFRVFLPMHDL